MPTTVKMTLVVTIIKRKLRINLVAIGILMLFMLEILNAGK
jgi:hypothetical protein